MTPLQKAAQALLNATVDEEWGEAHSVLRKALSAEIAQTAEPFAWLGNDGVLHFDKPDAVYGIDPEPLYLHPPRRPRATPIEPLGESDKLKDAVRLMMEEIENVDYAICNGAIHADIIQFEKAVSALKAVL